MRRAVVIHTLEREKARLESQFGVKILRLFGLVARDEAGPGSAVDLLVEFNKPVGYFGLFSRQDHLEKLLDRLVNLGTPDSLQPRLRERALGESMRII